MNYTARPPHPASATKSSKESATACWPLRFFCARDRDLPERERPPLPPAFFISRVAGWPYDLVQTKALRRAIVYPFASSKMDRRVGSEFGGANLPITLPARRFIRLVVQNKGERGGECGWDAAHLFSFNARPYQPQNSRPGGTEGRLSYNRPRYDC